MTTSPRGSNLWGFSFGRSRRAAYCLADQWFAGGGGDSGGSGGNHMAATIGGNVWGLQMAVL